MASVPQRDDSNSYFGNSHPFWCGILDRFYDHFITVDMSKRWRDHVIYSKSSGAELRQSITQRFSSSTIFLSVILSAEIGMLTSPANLSAEVRDALATSSYTLAYWTGIVVSFATLVAIAAITANYSAYAVFAAISNENLHIIAKSSIGFYAAQLPSYLIVLVLYTFLSTITLFWVLAMPRLVTAVMTTCSGLFLVYIISAYSALGTLVMSSGSMRRQTIIGSNVEDEMTPHQLSDELLYQKRKNMRRRLSIVDQYRTPSDRSAVRKSNTQSTREEGAPSESGSEIRRRNK
ncbi:unnamed protein product [Cylindrotheca closterium]|uniref:Uncharacterized protein n=1 Tax=Cylindrotheca closterium TaxID=2856 RepID=A0AAD2JIU2_9STRA|nr:unnamed protein product [Cylindrotheca closterium]